MLALVECKYFCKTKEEKTNAKFYVNVTPLKRIKTTELSILLSTFGSLHKQLSILLTTSLKSSEKLI